MLFTRGAYNDEINMEDIRMAGCCSSAHRSHNYICNEYISLQLQDEFRYWCRSSPWQTDLGQQGNHSVILVFLYRNTDHCNIAGGCAFPWHDRGYGFRPCDYKRRLEHLGTEYEFIGLDAGASAIKR